MSKKTTIKCDKCDAEDASTVDVYCWVGGARRRFAPAQGLYSFEKDLCEKHEKELDKLRKDFGEKVMKWFGGERPGSHDRKEI